MTFEEYQDAVRRTTVYKCLVVYPALKLNGEAGEVAELVGKVMRGDYTKDNEPVDANMVESFINTGGMFKYDLVTNVQVSIREKLVKELGDVLWYIAAIAEDIGSSLREVAEWNASKVQDRRARGVLHGSGDER